MIKAKPRKRRTLGSHRRAWLREHGTNFAAVTPETRKAWGRDSWCFAAIKMKPEQLEQLYDGKTIIIGIDPAHEGDRAAYAVMCGNRLLGTYDTESEAQAVIDGLEGPDLGDALALTFAAPLAGMRPYRLPHPDAIPVVMTTEQIAELKADPNWIKASRG